MIYWKSVVEMSSILVEIWGYGRKTGCFAAVFFLLDYTYATINKNENALPTDLESSFSVSKKKKKKERNLDNRVEQVDSNGQTNAVEDSQAKPPPNKIECFQLNVESNNKWAPDLDLAEYANTFIQNFAPTQTFKESTLDKNQVPTNIKEENLLDQYLLEQSKCIPLSQDK